MNSNQQMNNYRIADVTDIVHNETGNDNEIQYFDNDDDIVVTDLTPNPDMMNQNATFEQGLNQAQVIEDAFMDDIVQHMATKGGP